MRLIAAGHTNRQIADSLTLSVRTVESHRANLMDKLGLRSRVELVRYAAKHGLLDPASPAIRSVAKRHHRSVVSHNIGSVLIAGPILFSA